MIERKRQNDLKNRIERILIRRNLSRVNARDWATATVASSARKISPDLFDWIESRNDEELWYMYRFSEGLVNDIRLPPEEF